MGQCECVWECAAIGWATIAWLIQRRVLWELRVLQQKQDERQFDWGCNLTCFNFSWADESGQSNSSWVSLKFKEYFKYFSLKYVSCANDLWIYWSDCTYFGCLKHISYGNFAFVQLEQHSFRSTYSQLSCLPHLIIIKHFACNSRVASVPRTAQNGQRETNEGRKRGGEGRASSTICSIWVMQQLCICHNHLLIC